MIGEIEAAIGRGESGPGNRFVEHLSEVRQINRRGEKSDVSSIVSVAGQSLA